MNQIIKFINLLSLASIAASVLALFGAILLLVWSCFFYFSSIEGTALIIDFKEEITESSNTLYSPKFKFTATDGESYVVQTSLAYAHPKNKVGDIVNIRYRELDPESAKTDDFLSLWDLPTICAILGIFYLLISSLVYTFTNKILKKMNHNTALKRDRKRLRPCA